MDTMRKANINHHHYTAVKALTSAINHMLDAQNESTGSPPLSALQHAEEALQLLDRARNNVLLTVAELAAEYTAQGGDPR